MSQHPHQGVSVGLKGRVYLAVVIAAGLAVVGLSVYRLFETPIDPQWYWLVVMTLASGSLTVKLPSIPATISVSETFVFASVLLYGQSAGTITVALDGLVMSFWMAKRRPEWYRALFNMAAPALSIWCAAQLFHWATGSQPLLQQPNPVNGLLLPLGLFTVVFFGLNSGLVTLAIGFETGAPRYRIWKENFRWVSLNYFCGASIALLLVAYTKQIDVRFIGLILPLLFVLYLTFKTTMQRVEEANAHVTQVNRLYLSTIETIALAIDAKDQITHGHIRRVQNCAMGLARHLGVTDEGLLKAIEAAALLHDTGKLAVPEYILNKPGKLTPAEFEKMKLHVTVGAEILAAVNFPFPVVPIVKCHHENWDGSGYPNGIKGTEIPIGARILSVVDCFDALTSDRPYRPALSDREALDILFQRRGNMYDPLVVDVFARVYRDLLPPPESEPTRETMALQQIIASTAHGVPAPGSSFSRHRAPRPSEPEAAFDSALQAVIERLRESINPDLLVFYQYNPETDDLDARHVVGEIAPLVKGSRMELGQRLSGWVAANLRTIHNSDAALDLAELARVTDPPLAMCLSTPAVAGDSVIGVLSVYSRARTGFTDSHREALEAAAREVAEHGRRELAVKTALQGTTRKTSLTQATALSASR
jgi:putative nucleotidyltransferase with HDIG domain